MLFLWLLLRNETAGIVLELRIVRLEGVGTVVGILAIRLARLESAVAGSKPYRRVMMDVVVSSIRVGRRRWQGQERVCLGRSSEIGVIHR